LVSLDWNFNLAKHVLGLERLPQNWATVSDSGTQVPEIWLSQVTGQGWMAKVHDVACLNGNEFNQLLGGWVVAAGDLYKQRDPH